MSIQFSKLKNVNILKKEQQKNIPGGVSFPSGNCNCITRDRNGFLVISEDVPCDSICEDGSNPV